MFVLFHGGLIFIDEGKRIQVSRCSGEILLNMLIVPTEVGTVSE